MIGERAYQELGAGQAEYSWVRSRAGGPKSALAERLIELRAIRGAADDLMRVEVHRLRTLGWTWAEVAACLGITRQAAQQRYR